MKSPIAILRSINSQEKNNFSLWGIKMQVLLKQGTSTHKLEKARVDMKQTNYCEYEENAHAMIHLCLAKNCYEVVDQKTVVGYG